MMPVRVKRTEAAKAFPLPMYHSAGASGLDLYAVEDKQIPPRFTVRIATGLMIELPSVLEAQVRPRSGLSSKGIIAVFGTVDSDYRGEINVTLHNATSCTYDVKKGDRIGQLVICPVLRVLLTEFEGELDKTSRGSDGWGSTGR